VGEELVAGRAVAVDHDDPGWVGRGQDQGPVFEAVGAGVVDALEAFGESGACGGSDAIDDDAGGVGGAAGGEGE